MARHLLFRREFMEYTGGHGKVYDYFRHACAHSGWRASLYLTASSVWNQNPWLDLQNYLVADYEPISADVLFIAGMDWQAYSRDIPGKPVINLIQHVRHAVPGHPLHEYLHRPAIRICVSREVAHAILSSGCVRGPVHVIEAALNVPPRPDLTKDAASIFVDAIKQPTLGLSLGGALAKTRKAKVITQRIPRLDYLDCLARADIAVLLPNPTEGFYLPALEAMALGCAVVVPDCVGNRAYARDRVNSMMPLLDALQILEAIGELSDDSHLRESLGRNGLRTSQTYSQQRERHAFHSVLDQVDELWSSI